MRRSILVQFARQRNDCGVCSLVNASRLLGIPLDYKTALVATEFSDYGSTYRGSKWLSEHYPVEWQVWPIFDDNWPLRPVKDYEAETMRLWNAFKDRLLDGWIGITQHHWDDINDHAVVFSEYRDNQITVLCSMKGVYQIRPDWLRWKDYFQPIIFTNWLRKKATS